MNLALGQYPQKVTHVYTLKGTGKWLQMTKRKQTIQISFSTRNLFTKQEFNNNNILYSSQQEI